MLAELRGEPIPENVEEPETHKEKADFNAMAQEEITFTFDTVYVVRKAREDIDLMPLRVTSAASATVWSSARMTRPSRSTSIPTFPAQP